MRRFKNLDEVLDNLDTITMEEALDCHDRLGIVFTVTGNGFEHACYEDNLDTQDLTQDA